VAGRKGTVVADNKRLHDSEQAVGFLTATAKQARLILRLLGDRRVPIWPKLIIPATIAYVISPIDLLADPILGLGQIDDVAVFFIGLKLFIELCPTHIVREHLDDLSSVISGSYRVVKEEPQDVGPPQARLSAPEGEPSDEDKPANDAE
jgi:uncharacterized membrane protein YkvA (DUF1232 family)